HHLQQGILCDVLDVHIDCGEHVLSISRFNLESFHGYGATCDEPHESLSFLSAQEAVISFFETNILLPDLSVAGDVFSREADGSVCQQTEWRQALAGFFHDYTALVAT